MFDFPFLKVILLITKSIPYVFLNPLFWFVVFLVWLQYKRTTEMEEKLFGRYITSLSGKTFNALIYGLIGGIVGSFLLIFVGVSITNVGIHIAWFLALFLMLIHPRFICFSYAGGILALFSLIFGYPKIDVPGLMAIVAILHFLEGVLVYINGHKEPTPIFMKDEEYGIVGGFTLQKFWPLPLMILLTVVAGELPEEVINMPEWWPLIRPSPDITGNNFFYMMFPIVAGLGYGDISLTHLPERKAKISAINLGIFSTILLILAVFASRINIFKYVIAFLKGGATVVDPTPRIGQEIRRVRTEQGLTLEEAAQRSNVSKAMLGQIERGESNPTISILWKISSGLRVSLSTLLSFAQEDYEVISISDLPAVRTTDGKMQLYDVFSL